VNSTPSQSAIDNLLRSGAKQADEIVLCVDSGISLEKLSSALHDRIRRSAIKNVTVIINGKDRTYAAAEIARNGFLIRQADLQ